jgi:hypothetical protein
MWPDTVVLPKPNIDSDLSLSCGVEPFCVSHFFSQGAVKYPNGSNSLHRETERLNFVQKSKTSSGWGQTNNQDIPITDVTIYQNAFERIENAIFLRQ